MQDCYEDCPYYEQLQFAQDTRSAALFTYYAADDDRLAQQALLKLHSLLQPTLEPTASRAPCVHLQIISDAFLLPISSQFAKPSWIVSNAVPTQFRLVWDYENDDCCDFVDWSKLWAPMEIPPATKRCRFQTSPVTCTDMP